MITIPEEIVEKRPDEVLDRFVDFAKWLDTGDELTGTPVVEIEAGSGLTASGINISGTKVHMRLTGGTPQLAAYSIFVSVTLEDDQVLEAEVKLRVLEG